MKLVVVEFDSGGGLLHYVYQLCTAFAEQSIEVTLITGSEYELKEFPHNFHVETRLRLWPRFDPASMEQLPARLLSRILKKTKWTLRRVIRSVKLVREWCRLTHYLLKLKPDLIQFSEIRFPFEALFLRRLRRNNLILSQICHEFERRESRGWLKTIIDRLYASTFKQFSAIFFLARKSRERFLTMYDYPTEDTYIIPHGNEGMFLSATVDSAGGEELKKRYALSDNDRVVLFFGNLTPSKGIPDLIDAFALVVSKHPQAKLVIAGYPTKHIDMNMLKKQVADNKLADHVIFDSRYIPITSIGSLMQLATVVGYPYHSSSQSGSLQVAYTFGRPVVATAVGGLSEIVEDGKSGFLVPPKAPRELAEKIILLLDSPELAAQMGRYARELSETRYGWGPIAEQIVSVYRQLVREKTIAGVSRY